MSGYSIVLFLHIVGALGFFVVLGLEWIGLWQIRSALLPEEVRAWMRAFKTTNPLGFISMLTTVVTGIYMLLKVWGFLAWIIVVIGALVLEIVLFLVLTTPRMAAIGQALATEKRPFSPSFHNLVNNSVLWISIQVRLAIILGIVFLKIAKPDLVGSLLTIGVAILLGFASAFPIPRRERVQEGSAD